MNETTIKLSDLPLPEDEQKVADVIIEIVESKYKV